MMIDEMIALFMSSRKRGTDGARKRCAPKTIDMYERNLGIFWTYLNAEVSGGGVTRYESLKKLHLLAFLDWVEAKQSSGVWSKATGLQLLRCLKAFFRWVDKDEDCQEAGLKGLQRHLPAIEKNPHRKFIPSKEQMKRFRNSFNTANTWGYRNYVAVCLLLSTGMRISELCNLKVEETKLDDRTLIARGKTGPRLIPVTKELVPLLKGWLKHREDCTYAAGSDYVFISKRGPQMDAEGFGKAFRKHVAKNGLAKVSPHTLRHAFCTYYLAEGGSIVRLKNISGHTTLAQLEDYVHLAELGGRGAADELERVNPNRL
jgi:site-specific recombinase XerD